MKKSVLMLRIAGIFSILFVFSHLLFYWQFKWEHTLQCLSPLNASIFLTYHAICILVLAFIGFLSVFQTKTLLNSSLKYSLLGMFTSFYILRIITEFVLFGKTQDPSVLVLILCAIPAILSFLPMFYKSK